MDTTIKVNRATRDHLAEVAAARGITLRALVTELAEAALTPRQRAEITARTRAYLLDNLGIQLSDDDLAEGERLWDGMFEGRPDSTARDVA